MQFRHWAVTATALLALTACAGDDPSPTPQASPSAPASLEPSEPFGLTTVTLRPPDGGTARSLPVYDAYTQSARQRGLMGRRHLPRHAGMVFRFGEDRTGGFWMKNTLIPLSIAYFDRTGEVVAILDMQPCTQDPCPSYRPGRRYRGALEVNQGYLAEIGAAQGWFVELPGGLPAPE